MSELDDALRTIIDAIEHKGFEAVCDEINVCTGDIFPEDEEAPEWTERFLSAVAGAVRTVHNDEEGLTSITVRFNPGEQVEFAFDGSVPMERDDFRDAIEHAVQSALDGTRHA